MQPLNSIFKAILLFAVSILTADAPQWGHLFPSSPCLNAPCDPQQMFWKTEASVLAWQGREEGLEIALDDHSLVNLDFKWEPGFKIAVGADFPVRGWIAKVQWTYFHSESKKSISGNLTPIWVLPNSSPPFSYTSAKAAWTLFVNDVDIELGYQPFLSPAMALRWHFDIKVITVDQHFHVDYLNAADSAHTHISNQSIGAGPRVGFDSKWFLGKGFSLLAHFSGSLPLWHYRICRSDLDEVATGGIALNFRQRFWTFRSILEAALGFGWDTCLGCRSQFPFGLALAYELQYFPEQNMMSRLVNPGVLSQVFEPRGDLHLHGATFNLHFGF